MKKTERRAMVRRKDDRGRVDILQKIEDDFAAVVRPLQDEIERQKDVRIKLAQELRDQLDTIKFNNLVTESMVYAILTRLDMGGRPSDETRQDRRQDKEATS